MERSRIKLLCPHILNHEFKQLSGYKGQWNYTHYQDATTKCACTHTYTHMVCVYSAVADIHALGQITDTSQFT